MDRCKREVDRRRHCAGGQDGIAELKERIGAATEAVAEFRTELP
jgi:hypothetical protein